MTGPLHGTNNTLNKYSHDTVTGCSNMEDGKQSLNAHMANDMKRKGTTSL